jgi:hypothetical protein
MFKFENVNWFFAVMIYVGFFALIGGSIYLTKSSAPLWALLLTPTVSLKKDGGCDISGGL